MWVAIDPLHQTGTGRVGARAGLAAGPRRVPPRLGWSRKETLRMLSRILVPLDGSPAMEAILPTVRHLAGGTGAVVHLLALRPSARELAREDNGLRNVYVDDILVEGLVGWMPPAVGPRRSLETRLREE